MATADIDMQLTGDIVLTKQYELNRDLSIDLNGHSMSGSLTTPLFNVIGGTLSIKNGTMSNVGRIANVSNGATIVIESGTYTSTSAEVIRALPLGNVIVQDGDLTGREGAITTREKGENNECNATITINGGHLVGTDNFAVATNGSTGMGHNRITINGGLLEGNIVSGGYEAIGVYVANDDTFEMNGGEIIAHGGTGICQRGGTVTINNGTVTATRNDKNGNPVADGKVGDDNTILEGVSAIVYHKKAGYAGNTNGMQLVINGGTITGEDHSIQTITDEVEPNVLVFNGTLTPAYPENNG